MNTKNAAKPHKHYVFAALPVPVAAVKKSVLMPI